LLKRSSLPAFGLPWASGTALLLVAFQGALRCPDGDPAAAIRTWSRSPGHWPWCWWPCLSANPSGLGLFRPEPASSASATNKQLFGLAGQRLVDGPASAGGCVHPGHLRSPDGQPWASGRLPCQRRSLPVVSPPSPSSPRLLATAVLRLRPRVPLLLRGSSGTVAARSKQPLMLVTLQVLHLACYPSPALGLPLIHRGAPDHGSLLWPLPRRWRDADLAPALPARTFGHPSVCRTPMVSASVTRPLRSPLGRGQAVAATSQGAPAPPGWKSPNPSAGFPLAAGTHPRRHGPLEAWPLPTFTWPAPWAVATLAAACRVFNCLWEEEILGWPDGAHQWPVALPSGRLSSTGLLGGVALTLARRCC